MITQQPSMPVPAPAGPSATAAGLGAADLQWVRELVRREAAIMLDGKDYLIDSRLDARVRKSGAGGKSELVAAARGGDRRAAAAIVEALTTNETSWFRDGGPFEALRTTVLPEMIRARAAERSLRIWSAACSTGQEAYSVGMICSELLPADWRLEIVGTDLSDEVLAQAAAGRYSQLEVNRGLPAPMLVKWFRRAGREWEVAPQLRAMVRWQKLNLVRPFPAALGRFDVVLLRNVLIYFDPPTKTDVLDRTRALLRPDGFLILGGAETTLGLGDTWTRQTVGSTPVWRQSGAPPVPAARAAAVRPAPPEPRAGVTRPRGEHPALNRTDPNGGR